MSAVDIIDSEVREIVRRQSLDPLSEPSASGASSTTSSAATTSARCRGTLPPLG